MKKLLQLTESDFKEHNWKKIISDIGGKFIHMHPEFGEVEMEYSGKHVLIEHENDRITVSEIKELGNAGDSQRDDEITTSIKDILDNTKPPKFLTLNSSK